MKTLTAVRVSEFSKPYPILGNQKTEALGPPELGAGKTDFDYRKPSRVLRREKNQSTPFPCVGSPTHTAGHHKTAPPECHRKWQARLFSKLGDVDAVILLSVARSQFVACATLMLVVRRKHGYVRSAFASGLGPDEGVWLV